MKNLYILIIILIAPLFATAQVINTVAGIGVAGYSGNGGPANQAEINYPIGIVADDLGNIYFGDVFNHVVRKVDTNGIITTIAGTGTEGTSGDGGQATAANLEWPMDFILDNQNNLYICDFMADRIRKLNLTTGIITTVAGTNSGFGGDGGPAIAANLNSPTEIDLDSNGNLYITDQGNDRIRKVDAQTGIITTFAGNGTASYTGDGGPAIAAGINHPYGLAIDHNNNIFFSQYNNAVIRRIDGVTNTITTIAGNGTAGFSGDGGPATSASLNFPEGICVDSVGNVYIAELNNYRIRKVDMATNTINTIAGNGSGVSSGDGGHPLFAGMYCTSVDVKKGKIYIVDINHRIRVVTVPNPNAMYATVVEQAATTCFNGNDGYFTISGNNGTEPYQYKIGNGPYQNSGLFQNLAPGTYTVTIMDANNYTTTIIVTVGQPPAPVVTTSITGTVTLCQNDTLPVAVYVNGVVSNDCSWSNNGTGSNINITAPGIYTVTCNDYLGCPGTSAEINVIEQPAPNANFTYLQISNYVVDFTNTSANGITYQWMFPNGTQLYTEDAQHSFLSDGIFPVTLIAYNACGADTVTIQVVVVKTGLLENGTLSSFNILPNPSNGNTSIAITSPQPVNGNLQVYTMQGKLVFQQAVSFASTYNQTFDFGAFANGMYIISLVTNQGISVKKLVLQK